MLSNPESIQSLSSTSTSISNSISVFSDRPRPEMSINEIGNRLYLDYKREATNWIYGESDVEIGLTNDLRISYISIEIKSRKAIEDLDLLKEAVENERAKGSSEE